MDVFVSITIAAAIGIPAGVVITRKPGLEKGILGFANVVQRSRVCAVWVSHPLAGSGRNWCQHCHPGADPLCFAADYSQTLTLV